MLPSGLTLVSADASSGIASANTGTNTVTWNGVIPAQDSVTISITATINSGTQGQTISNQGTISYDADGNGTNEATALTDDPTVGGSSDPTSFTVCFATSVVTTNADNGAGSLRQIISDACPGTTITFDMAQVTSPITLTNGEILIDKNLTIKGPTTKSLVISGNNNSRIFNIAQTGALSISNLTFTKGQSNSGGAIHNLGDLVISNSTFTDNHAIAGAGGAIDSEGGTLKIINSTISGNTADTNGGGLLNSGNSLARLTNVTITNNRADADGDSTGDGGGISEMSDSGITVNNTIVAGNFKGASPGTTPNDFFVLIGDPLVPTSFIDPGSSNNLIGVDTGLSTDISNGTNGNQIGTAANPIDPRLAPLADNGGPTKTHFLLSDSPALNTGSNDLARDQSGSPLATDQRGTGFPRIINSIVDIGALEANYSISATAGNNQSATINTQFATLLKATVIVEGQPGSNIKVTFTAPSSGASGTFTGNVTTVSAFTDVNGVATAPTFTANGTAGSYSVTATLPSGLPSATFNLTNAKANQTITVNTHAPSSATYNTTFTVSATASSGLPVTYTSSGACTNTGATFTMTSGTGTCSVIYNQAGNANINAAPQVTETVAAQKASQTITFGSLANKTFGDADFQVSASSSSGLTVSFAATGNCTITGSKVHLTGAGSCTITASQAGDSNYSAAADVPQTFQIAKSNQTITFGALSNKTYGDAPFTVSATASSNLSVSFSSQTTSVCTVSGNTVTLLAAGLCTIRASQTGDSNYNAATPVDQSFTVNKAVTTTTVTSSQNPSDFGQSVTFTATVTGPANTSTPTGTVQFTDDGNNIGNAVTLNSSGVATFTTSSLSSGPHTIRAIYSGDVNFGASTGTLANGQTVRSQPTLDIKDITLPEGNAGTTDFNFTVTLSAASNLTVTVNYATADGTATVANNDYQSASGILTFNPGDLTKTITVKVNGDTVAEPDEIFFVNLSSAVNAIIKRTKATGTILNDDAPVVQFSSSTYSVAENGSHAVIAVNRLGDISNPATVDYATSDSSGLLPCSHVTGMASQRCDYAISVGTLRFAAGESSKIIFIPIVNDVWVEGPETFNINLSNPTGGSLGTQASATITINDDDNGIQPNPIIDNAFFVRQLYIDFLGREPDPIGYPSWQSLLNNCPQSGKDANGQSCDRIAVALGFIQSAEFIDRAYFIFRFYTAALGRNPNYNEFIPDMARLSGFLNDAELEANKSAFVDQFMSRQEFKNLYDATLNDPTGYVDKLLKTAGLPNHPTRSAWIAGLSNNTLTRQQVLRQLVESAEVQTKFFNQAFVVMQYFSFLRRDPDADYQFWIDKLNASGNDYRLIIDGFIRSNEYLMRVGP